MVINDFEKINGHINKSQLQQLSIDSSVINYVQYDRNCIDYYKFDIRALKPKNHKRIHHKLEEHNRQVINLDFGVSPENLKGEYLDLYGVRSEI